MECNEKISVLENYLSQSENYADSFKGEIYCIMGDFEEGNPMLAFFENLEDEKAIHQHIDSLTSRIVMKYDPEWESLRGYVRDYVENG
ncbi:hypothetical protein [Mongoliibacter ruber]|uniref:Uncharacterized protein n=1 Tax=Mongoliibacter ruber TaxID=1750599 RepID=A0A2T0WT30_9BACT|nr:hypothetical protein [Mongoliibacter ruber]PRY89838.1 hypothetical protein CLW00_102314 [Mongoliibacter ruber]